MLLQISHVCWNNYASFAFEDGRQPVELPHSCLLINYTVTPTSFRLSAFRLDFCHVPNLG